MSADPASPPRLTIRPATAADAALVLQFVRELAAYEELAHEVIADERAVHDRLLGEPRGAEVLLAFAEGEPAGFAVFFQNFSTFLMRSGIYLEDLFVRPTLRRSGIGRALLEHLARETNRRRCGRLEWSVLDWNEPAKDFYREMGATILEDWRICRLTGEALTRFRT